MAKEKAPKDTTKEPKKGKPAGDKKPKKAQPDDAAAAAAASAPDTPKQKAPTPRLKEFYFKEIVPQLRDNGKRNIMSIPKLEKIVLNMGIGEATRNAKVLDFAVDELQKITGQKAVIRRAKKAISSFKLRENMPIGASVTLRGDIMYEFLDRLISIALPRVRDFRGLNPNSFDGRGSYTMGLKDQLIFPEIDYAKVDKMRGMNVTIVTSAKTDDDARTLLLHLGMPFRK